MSICSKIIFTICLLVSPIIYVQAQNYNYKDRLKENQEHYLAGAVPEVDGKVVFSETIQTNHTAAEIIQMLEEWAENKNKTDNKFYTNKIIYNDRQKNELALLVNDRLMFTDLALSQDYTLITYYIILEADNNKCIVTLKNIKYEYADFKNQVTADETISDEVALNKEKTKLYSTNNKFRVATVDMAENIFDEIEKCLNQDEYNAIKNASKARRENNVIQEETTTPTHQRITEAPTPPSTIISASANSVVAATQKTLNKLSEEKAFAFSNFFIVGENMAYVRQISAISLTETSILCYLNNDGTMLLQSQIMPSAKFKILYYTPEKGSYTQLSELSRKYANNEAYTDADISMIEVLLENSKDTLQINHLKIETIPTKDISYKPTIYNMPTVGTFINTNECIVITGDVIN